ncbi:GNAT family N-acetyltransferase [Pelagicoccus sp. SDUM812003]|uniref:GNAT family N-acetyltransferase n=1 Tax=Pelagicoccus sp. SDUM812003 TaxID=3041267 RepID=UPI00280E37E5|nr:GNAT family N-acetyltransferase [Pelagicoccus sp. SDUM812003]MDQ8205610.1 GNAT family N-acetyltransferase [Pelagicoccus sp. SDUM812003]
MERVNPATIRPPSLIETERLLLRRPRLEDAFDLFELALADEAFARATVGDQPLNLEATCTAIVRMLAETQMGNGAWWIVVEKETGRVAGLTGFTHRARALGPVNALAKEVMGRGYARETVEALLACGLSRDSLHRHHVAEEDAEVVAEDSKPASRWYWHCKSTSDKNRAAATARFA